MNKLKNNNFEHLKSQFKNAVNLQQSCKVHITTIQNYTWSFYFKSGQLIWATGSQHRFRRIDRLINRFCPEIDYREVKLREHEITELWEYLFIRVLNKRQLISTMQAQKTVLENIGEILFDCLQADNQIVQIKSIFETSANQMGGILRSHLLKEPIAIINIFKLCERVEAAWQAWKNAELTSYSPNLTPVIIDSNKLKDTTDAEFFKKLSVPLDGTQTLRDLSISTKQQLLTLTCSLLPYIENGSIGLREIEDIQLENLFFSAGQDTVNQSFNRTNPNRDFIQESDLTLIFCVDDSPRICQQMVQILNPAGYRVISVNESVQALSVLLETQPDLIFLDMVMPVVNGYELCGQIRRISKFRDTPIVILTDNDSFVDRIRVKMVGASDSIAKPIDRAEILAIAQKYTQSATSNSNSALSLSQ